MTDKCKNCGETRRSLETLTREALARCKGMVEPGTGLFDAIGKVREANATGSEFKILRIANDLIRYAHDKLVRELTSAMDIAGSDYCGICTVAKEPQSCADCYAVALWGVTAEDIQTRVAEARAKFAERGEPVGHGSRPIELGLYDTLVHNDEGEDDAQHNNSDASLLR